jgi:hypothetical protein
MGLTAVWYAGFEIDTAQAEVAHHKSVELAEIDWFDEEIIYGEYLADFSAELHDIRKATECKDCLDPDSYLASQDIARQLLDGVHSAYAGQGPASHAFGRRSS